MKPRSRRRAALAILAAVGAALALLWFEPHQLFIDETVDEPPPTAPASPPATTGNDAATASSVPSAPVELLGGELVSRDHDTSGSVVVLELVDGSRVLRIEDLDTDNGPDLYVYLSDNPADGDEGAFDDDYVSLGRLKGNLGDQNYEVPSDLDLEGFRSVVIWCDRFNSAFGAADLLDRR